MVTVGGGGSFLSINEGIGRYCQHTDYRKLVALPLSLFIAFILFLSVSSFLYILLSPALLLLISLCVRIIIAVALEKVGKERVSEIRGRK